MSTWAASQRWSDLPDYVQTKAIATLRDSMSVMFGGVGCESARLAAEFERGAVAGEGASCRHQRELR
jgi:hypothetical protein